MCVIFVARDRPVTANEVEQAAKVNSDGIGMAWFRRGKVAWKKGLSVDNAMWLCGKVPLPYVFHARLATVGGKVDSLSHPFPIAVDQNMGKAGESRRVLFHNGHVSNWYPLALAAGVTVGTGHYSDSSIVAKVLATIPRKKRAVLLKELPGRWVIMGDGEVKCIGEFHDMKGMLASNDRYTCTYRKAHTLYRGGYDWFQGGRE